MQEIMTPLQKACFVAEIAETTENAEQSDEELCAVL
jgi:hypothetical protein